MTLRSFLLVRADATDAAHTLRADALVLDLLELGDAGRVGAARWLEAERQHLLYLRVHPLGDARLTGDLAALLPLRPDGILLPRCRSPADVQHLGAKLAVHEAEHGLQDGQTRILAAAAETPDAIFALGHYAGASRRLAGLIETPIALAAALGVAAAALAVVHAGTMLMIGARAAGVPAIGWSGTGSAGPKALAAAETMGFQAVIAQR